MKKREKERENKNRHKKIKEVLRTTVKPSEEGEKSHKNGRKKRARNKVSI